MHISTYIRQQPEYRNAQNVYKATEGKSFPYVAPIIILEGMKFYDDYLLTKIL